jgi:hypothetical protein
LTSFGVEKIEAIKGRSFLAARKNVSTSSVVYVGE